MSQQDRTDRGDAADTPRAPSHCPACHSSDVVTASKVVTAASYWRCEICGEVWNVARLTAAGRHTDDRFYRR